MRSFTWMSFRAADGTEIRYRYWPAIASSETPNAVMLLHRGHEHSGRMQHVVDELALPDVDFFAWDARGHGRSPGKRGHAPNVATLVRDLDDFSRHIAQRHGIAVREQAVIAQSVGSVISSCWAHDYAPQLRGMVLAAPAFTVKLYLPFARNFLALALRFRRDITVHSYVKARHLTQDAARAQEYTTDRLITRDISARLLLDLHQASQRVVDDAAAIHVPTQMLVSGKDMVVRRKPQLEFFHRLSSARKELVYCPGLLHDILGERDRAHPIAKTRTFLRTVFAEAHPPQLPAVERCTAHTQAEYDALRKPLPFWSPRRWGFALLRACLRIGASLSRGMRVGYETGFDSGSSLDYVYRNCPEGLGFFGRWLDRNYLDAPGWRGIRVRKQNVEALLQSAIGLRKREGQPVTILDIAAGHGRYVLDAMEPCRDLVDRVLLRDYCPRNVAVGDKRITERGMQDIATFQRADAFQRDNFLLLRGQYGIAVVSGLYELFPDNTIVQESLAGVADAVPLGGYLVYTGQPWHPQLETIARTLHSHRDAAPWVMRRRTQAELDRLVADAGFEKIDQRIDADGIFTVSLARRIAHNAQSSGWIPHSMRLPEPTATASDTDAEVATSLEREVQVTS